MKYYFPTCLVVIGSWKGNSLGLHNLNNSEGHFYILLTQGGLIITLTMKKHFLRLSRKFSSFPLIDPFFHSSIFSSLLLNSADFFLSVTHRTLYILSLTHLSASPFFILNSLICSVSVPCLFSIETGATNLFHIAGRTEFVVPTKGQKWH